MLSFIRIALDMISPYYYRNPKIVIMEMIFFLISVFIRIVLCIVPELWYYNRKFFFFLVFRDWVSL